MDSENEVGNSYLFNADAQAILEEAPDLETGLAWLSDSYKASTWDDPQAAADITSKYAQSLRYKFEENPKLSDEEVVKLAPIDLTEIEAEGEDDYERNVDQITKWESANTEFLDTTTDGDFLVSKERLKTNIQDYASRLRREANGKDQTWLSDIFYRTVEGLTAAPAKAIGADDYVRWIREKTDPSWDDDLSSDIASGLGMVLGITGSAAVPGGSALYLGTSGAGQVRGRYEESMEATGDPSRAARAATIEGVSQLTQLVPAERVFGGAVRRVLGKQLPQVGSSFTARVAKPAAIEGVSEATGQVISNVAQAEGLNQDIDPFNDVAKSAALGAFFGASSGSAEVWTQKRNLGQASTVDTTLPEIDPEPVVANIVGGVLEPEIESVGEVNTENVYPEQDVAPITDSSPEEKAADFITEDGNRYYRTEEGATRRTKVKSGENFQPFDKTFHVTEEVAQKLATLRNEEGPDGTPVNILTDGENLYVKSGFVNNDLTIGNEPTGARLIKVPVEKGPAVGLHPVEVNRPRNQNGNLREYRSHVGRKITEVNVPSSVKDPSVGAMDVNVTAERKFAERLRNSEQLDPELRAIFGTDDFGYFRYWPITNEGTKTAAQDFIIKNGPQASIARIVHTPDNVNDPETVAIGAELLKQTNGALEAARAQGDLEAVTRIADQNVQLFDALARKSTLTAQSLQAFNLFRYLDPQSRAARVRKTAITEAVNEAAAELELTPEQLIQTDVDLANVNKQIEQVQTIIEHENSFNTPEQPPEGFKPPETDIVKAQKEIIKDLSKRKKSLDIRKNKLESKKAQKIKEVEPELRELEKLFSVGKELTGSNRDRVLRAAFEKEDALLKKVKPDNQDNYLFTLYQANLLSNPATQAVNIWGNLTNILGDAASLYASGNTEQGSVFLKQMYQDLTNIGKEAALLELEGRATYRPYEDKYQGDNDGKLRKPGSRRPDAVTSAPDWAKNLGVGPFTLNKLGYVFRGLAAADAGFYHAGRGGYTAVAAYEQGKQQGLEGPALKAHISNALFNSKAEWEKARKQAESEAKIMEGAGIKSDPKEINFRTWEILDEKRAPEIRDEAAAYGQRATFTQDSDTVLGQLAQVLTRLNNISINVKGKDVKPLRYIQPFVKTVANIMDSYLDYLPPIGYVRSKKKGKTDIERKMLVGKAIIGSVAMASVYGMAAAFQDDDNPWFAVYGAGPADYRLKKQLMSQGWVPDSIRIGDVFIKNSTLGPLSFLLSSMGNVFDQQRWSPSYDKKTGVDFISMIVAANAKSLTNNTFLKGIGNLMKIVTGEEEAKITDLPISTAKGFVPASSALKEVSNWIHNPIETKDDLWAKFISGIPAAQSIGTRPALNEFGDPIDKTLDQRLGFLSRFYSRRVTDPDWRFLAESGYKLPIDGGLTSPLFKETDKTKFLSLSRSQKYGDGYSNVLTPEQRHRYIAESGPRIRAIVQKYRTRYGGAGFQQKVQDQMSKEIIKTRSEIRKRLILR